MNYIITPDYTIFNVKRKFKELAEYITTVSKNADVEESEKVLTDLYNLYKNSFGKSKKTFLLSVSNAVMANIFANHDPSNIPSGDIARMASNFFEIEKTIKMYSTYEGVQTMLKTISNTQGKTIYLGNSRDDLDLEKANILSDIYNENYFDETDNCYNNDNETMLRNMLELYSLKPEDTVLITADEAKAFAGSKLDMNSWYIDREKAETPSVSRAMNADYAKYDIEVFDNNKEINERMFNGVALVGNY